MVSKEEVQKVSSPPASLVSKCGELQVAVAATPEEVLATNASNVTQYGLMCHRYNQLIDWVGKSP